MTEVDNLEPQLIKTDKGNWELLWWGPSDPTPLFIRCANDGKGEVLTWHGTFYVWGKEHTTPSGNYIVNGKVTYGEDWRVIGQETGEVWLLESYNVNAPQITKQSDGMTYWQWIIQERLISQVDGDRMHDYGHFWLVFDPDGNLVMYREIVSCGPRK